MAEQRLDGIGDIALLDAEMVELFLIDHQPQTRARQAVTVPDVDDEGHAGENLLDLGGDRAAGGGIGAVDFGQQGRQHRRAGRDFDDLECAACGEFQDGETRPQVQRDGVAGAFAGIFGGEVDLQIAEFGGPAHERVPHQAVEVERGGGAGIGLH